MAFNAAQIREIRNGFATEIFASVSCPFTKADIDAAIVAADDWATANASSYNTALPQPFRSTATAGQKAALLAYVTLRRWKP